MTFICFFFFLSYYPDSHNQESYAPDSPNQEPSAPPIPRKLIAVEKVTDDKPPTTSFGLIGKKPMFLNNPCQSRTKYKCTSVDEQGVLYTETRNSDPTR